MTESQTIEAARHQLEGCDDADRPQARQQFDEAMLRLMQLSPLDGIAAASLLAVAEQYEDALNRDRD